MAKVVLVCGKICSGKSRYAAKLKSDLHAVVFSCDELINDIFPQGLGERHDETLSRVKLYLHKKAAEAVMAGTDVILDFGFWSRSERKSVSDFYTGMKVPFEWHYVDCSDEDWAKNISERNKLVTEGLSKEYYLDDGLMDKFASLFEKPERQEMTVWYHNRRL